MLEVKDDWNQAFFNLVFLRLDPACSTRIFKTQYVSHGKLQSFISCKDKDQTFLCV